MCEITEYSKDFVFVIICLTVAGIYLVFFCISVIKADVRLQDGIHPYHGRVEVNKHGNWGSVCETE